MIAGQADLTVAAITGAPLTPTVFRTFRGIHVVRSNEFLEPLKANALLVGAGLLFFAGVVVWMAKLVVGTRDAGRSAGAQTMIVGVVLLALPALVPWP